MNETLMAVTHELRCVQCKSVLRGLPVTGSCPECGTLIMHTLVGTLDVPSQALARPIHAQRVARSMLAISIGILLSIVGVTAPMFGRSVIDILGAAIPEGGTLADRMGVLLNALGTAVLLIGSLQLSRRDDPVLRTEIGRADRWLLAGLGIWIAAVGVSLVGVTFPFRSLGGDNLQQTWFVCGAVQLIGAAIGAVGLRRFVTVLGRRCRKYRHAGSARQSIETMVIAAAIALVASLSATILPGIGYADFETPARVMYFITAGLLLMGGIYIVINFGWIHRILTSPPPQLEKLVRVVLPLSDRESAN